MDSAYRSRLACQFEYRSEQLAWLACNNEWSILTLRPLFESVVCTCYYPGFIQGLNTCGLFHLCFSIKIGTPNTCFYFAVLCCFPIYKVDCLLQFFIFPYKLSGQNTSVHTNQVLFVRHLNAEIVLHQCC